MAPDARAAARGHAADARERKGGMACERRSAVVGHRRPTAAGCDVRTRVWQAVEVRLPARHGRCAARQPARGRRTLRWLRRRRRRRVVDARVSRLVWCSQCAVCVSVRVCWRSAPGLFASDVRVVNIRSIKILGARSLRHPADQRTSSSATSRTAATTTIIQDSAPDSQLLAQKRPHAAAAKVPAHGRHSGARKLTQHPLCCDAAVLEEGSASTVRLVVEHEDEAVGLVERRRAALSTAHDAQSP